MKTDPYSVFEEDLGAVKVDRLVPNEKPTQPLRLAIVGEAPGQNEVTEGRPFVGASGQLLFNVLGQLGLSRSECFVGNVCQHRPPNNDITLFHWDGAEIQSGLEVLRAELSALKPNLVLLLGRSALRAAGVSLSLDVWRGSLFTTDALGVPGQKCLSTYHPAAIFRQYSWLPLFRFDCRKALRECSSAALVRRPREAVVDVSAGSILTLLADIKTRRQPIALDIEGGVGCMTCVSIAVSPETAFIIPFVGPTGRCWNEVEELEIVRALADVLADPAVPKILQNYLYDAFVLGYSYRTPIRGLVDDTMLKHWELLSEMEKGLDVQASLYTDVAYYKTGRHSAPGPELYRYCCMDSMVTFEIAQKLDAELRDADARRHYAFNCSLLAPLLYMELRGIRYDEAAARSRAAEVRSEVFKLQHQVNLSAASAVGNEDDLLQLVRNHCCYKNAVVYSPDDLVLKPLARFAPVITRCTELVKLRAQRLLTDPELGELSMLTGTGLNMDSSPQVAKVLYETLKLPKQFKKERGRRTEKVTTDALAVLTLYAKTSNSTLLDMLRLRGQMTALETLDVRPDPDGRIRCAYNLVGSETGRLTCYTSPTGSGYNLQTVTKKHRFLFRADEGKWLFQCDLSGADGWTVAAHCAALGDRTMLDDYLNGIKPAKVVALMYEHGAEVNKLSREELKAMCKQVSQDGWLYFACKRVQHGTNYGMKEATMSDQILKDSYKLSGEPTWVPPSTCARLRALYLCRYSGVTRLQNAAAQRLKQTGKLKSASGHTRIFFGRREDYDTVKEFLADEPQENTTYATNLALQRLWTDPENRCADNSLVIEPLHQVHDALIGQFPQQRCAWATARIKSYFDNTLLIAGLPIKIPFEGAYGPSWGELTEAI